MSDQKPSVGAIVHYVSHGTPVRADGTQAFTSQCRAAIIAGVPELSQNDLQDVAEGVDAAGRINLVVLNPDGLFFKECRYDRGVGGVVVDGIPRHAGGTWHWPERV